MWRKAFAAGLLLAFVFAAAVSFAPETTQAVTTLSVRSFGAKGDGRTDDTKAFRIAMRAAVKAHAILFIPRGTYTGNVTIPSGVTIQGTGMETCWLKGRITFGSNCVVRDIKLGDAGYSTRNRANASNTRFERCRFRGGGGSDYDAAVVLLGWQYSCDHITFTDCDFERNVGTGTVGTNIVSVNNMAYSGGPQVEYITWERCHFGVDNGGANTVTPRAAIECTNKGNGTPIKGYHHMYVLDCVFEKTGWFTLDFADNWGYLKLCDNVVIRGNLIKGAGAAGTWGYGVCLEMPIGTIVENNTFYRCYHHPIKFAFTDGVENNTIIRNNTFQLDIDNGITPGTAVFYLGGGGSEIYGNTIELDYDSLIWAYWDSFDSVAYGNTVTSKFTGGDHWGWAQFSGSSNIRVAGTGNDATRNTLETYQTSDIGWQIGSGNSNITASPNILIAH